MSENTAQNRTIPTVARNGLLLLIRVAAALSTAALASPALAHHSFAMFDEDRQETLTGVVRAFEWTNPHAWIRLTVHAPGGRAQAWSIEAVGTDVLGRKGWTRASLKPGDAVVVLINPARDGSHRGVLIHAAGADGRKIGKVW